MLQLERRLKHTHALGLGNFSPLQHSKFKPGADSFIAHLMPIGKKTQGERTTPQLTRQRKRAGRIHKQQKRVSVLWLIEFYNCTYSFLFQLLLLLLVYRLIHMVSMHYFRFQICLD